VRIRVDASRRDATPPSAHPPGTRLAAHGLDLYYGAHQALKNITLEVAANSVTAIIGPSGCGKSTLLRTFNRMNDMIAGVRTTGEVLLSGVNVLDPAT